MRTRIRCRTLDLLNIFFCNRQLPPGSDVKFGEVSIQGWLDFEELLLEGATGSETDPLAFDEIIPVENVIDNSLIPDINEFDAEAIKEQARNYPV